MPGRHRRFRDTSPAARTLLLLPLAGTPLPVARLIPVALALKRAAATFQQSPEQLYSAITAYANAIPDAPGELTLAVVALTTYLSSVVNKADGVPALSAELRLRLGAVPLRVLTSAALQAAMSSPIGRPRRCDGCRLPCWTAVTLPLVPFWKSRGLWTSNAGILRPLT